MSGELLERGLRELKIEGVLERYARGGMPFGATAHQAGVSQSELARHAYACGLEPPFSVETLAEELNGARCVKGERIDLLATCDDGSFVLQCM